MISEEHAKSKWCPFTFGVPELRGPDGQGFREAGPWTCSASHCMAWVDDTYTETITTEPSSSSIGLRHEKVYGGHCGLINQRSLAIKERP